ncbi:MAG: alanyl-tRNA synthetase [Candidatus Peribacter riflensis]|uniref:Alanine--tRNA ligase n=1 Tax=Candidatus Peribacter riflensis TaxID=1735162 RepID=A0A0S1SMR7_9BACT|nr:MAG: alanyl-tRNA synthetase [Candidatus Peribacter riflensis]ALM10618.1 MAG: alanyl-tRNA synthetase [Candidatus Peribacter riflensis]ALM11720.1 MAG: alanyl-tRNA synthetase [Candidatus Peribacter riflensis]ALM12823.1 MAG: alanyl-tRNA synthetase [Candidatus Peribacter riflensis]ALM13924.1 MAG: alanyl-tRNA synthetase [Candidatus Peribacter riflensis]
MRPMSTDDIRQQYLDFFKKEGHAVIPGASLVPENDPTVLFTTAGMHPLVPYLMGEKHPAGKRLTDVQRCIRTQDIDEVGDLSHLTFFEMLGNWSLGDYFKEGAIEMSFKFLTEVLQIPVDMLAVTCFEGDKDAPKDEESAKIWEKLGIPRERIGFLPKAKNWWGPAGQTGPCGPDTEMFFWIGKGKPQGNPATHEKEWLEIWNDVFMQYNKKLVPSDPSLPSGERPSEGGTFEPLAQQNVDTGMGLERVAKVLQNVASVYETDRMKPIMDCVMEMADQRDERHLRIIVDHLKAATFIIADGVLPSNVDQGYILRRLIRRAIRSARQLKIEHDGTFTPAVAEAVIAQYGHVYGRLKDRRTEILEALSREEQQFGKTLKEGMKQFERATEHAGTQMDGTVVFHLYDTYGFPLELTKELALEKGLTVDEKGFKEKFEEHQALSRAGAEQKFKGGLQDHSSETTKLHTATHLLNAALRKVLGDHVYQKGSNITAERLRFDFSHVDKMTPEQLKEVQRLVNETIAADLPVAYHVTSVEGAKKEGAIGVFDAKYGAEVKVYVVGDDKKGIFSKEICGGPHVARTGMLGSLTIQKEESSSAGVRRIKAVIEGGPAEITVAQEE